MAKTHLEPTNITGSGDTTVVQGSPGIVYGDEPPVVEDGQEPPVWVNLDADPYCPYDVGQVYISSKDTSPASIYANTDWIQIKDQFILAAGDVYAAGSTGGNSEIVQTIDQMPSHRHYSYLYHPSGDNTYTGSGVSYTNIVESSTTFGGSINMTSNGGGQPMNIMPPYKAFYAWERVA